MKNEKMNNSKTKNGKGKKITLAIIGVLLALLILAGVFLWLNPTWLSHIKAAFLFMTNSKEKLESNIQKIEKDRIEAVQSSGLNVTKEAENALAEGLISTDQFQSILLGTMSLDEAIAQNTVPEASGETVRTDKASEDKSDNPDKTEDKTPADTPSQKDETPTKQPGGKDNTKTENPAAKPPTNPSTIPDNKNQNVDEQIASLVTKMYVLKSNYVGQIDGVIGAMKSEFYNLPNEQRTKSAKQSIATKYLSKINAMEAQCDAQVNAVVTELKQLLTKAGRDHSLADAIISTYQAEKENTKAYYISTYGD